MQICSTFYMSNTKLLNIDWLQISCTGELISKNPDVVVKRKLQDNGQPLKSKHYANLSEIYYRKELVATSESEPHSAIIPPRSVRIKLENRILYQKNAKFVVQNMLNDFGLTFNKISRIDIAMDFQKFDNDMKPETLIKKFLKNDLVKVGRGKFQVIGQMKTVSHRFEYFRIGSKATGKQIYLYNKSNEFREEKEKRYISQLWEMSGLSGQDVWRLEISISGNQHQPTDTETGEQKPISIFKIFSLSYIEQIFMSGINSLFEFRVKGEQKNISRMKKVPLFSDKEEFDTMRLLKTIDAPDSTRYHRGLISNLIKNLHHVPDHDFQLVQDSINTIWHQATLYNLQVYALEKTKEIYPNETLFFTAFQTAKENQKDNVKFKSLRDDSPKAQSGFFDDTITEQDYLRGNNDFGQFAAEFEKG